MNFNVSDEIRKQTTQCQSDFICLTYLNKGETPMCDNDNPMCPVESFIEGDGVFVKNKDPNTCLYMMSFGYGYICNCPTRCEIYRRYGQ